MEASVALGETMGQAADQRAAGGPVAGDAASAANTPAALIWRRFRRHRLALAGAAVIAALTALALFAPLVGRYPPDRIDLLRVDEPPSPAHWLGTDGSGRDYWSRLVHGARVSLSVGLVAVSISVAIAVVLGAVSGYFGGALDMAIQRFTELVMTLPTLLIIITLVALLRPSIYNVMAAIGLIGWTGLSRLVRGQVLQLKALAFVESARACGATDRRLIAVHILPNVLPYILVAATFAVANAILVEAGLSFLGLGVQPPTATWGNLLQEAQTLDALLTKPWRWLAPGLAIALTVLSINFIGDGLRDALDPRMQYPIARRRAARPATEGAA
jgi:peptide/nickel transport system permease protein